MLEDMKRSKTRWCGECADCSSTFLFLKALNREPKEYGFQDNLFKKKYMKYYPLFSKRKRIHEKPSRVRDEQLFAFYLAHRNDVKGYLIDLFKEKFLKEAKKREDELYKIFYGIHNTVTVPNKIRTKLHSIFKEELQN
jgi:hypothetical protein